MVREFKVWSLELKVYFSNENLYDSFFFGAVLKIVAEVI
jgi:hypothetical protein